MASTPDNCPNCGADVPRGAKACPGCGADDETGWSEAAAGATSADLGLPDEDFDYDEFVAREFANSSPKPHGLHWAWWLVAIGLLAAIVFAWIL